ncbi:putative lipoprotein [Leptospira yanagawae serovar Saopaulo str. Sao Paulo = ATCC 700523]|uniref:Lipoprotein n=2 Tax=Leptospira TaxID=171 RepID=A0AAW5VKH2_9LEPT|nr:MULTISPECIES: hypothetical protein [Leptospira]EOQ88547.1 putative lipoprotein [Leptospira yanagawae serovar Saopaulo str. Sao Paulo = ATCC 700523]MCW7494798.1 hypothetical protein [Leptospira soteropolitanensis]MCW7502379.1 hypothetical protein [Leptospira soteropolitanensis]MCW7524625.1 hypothetical protein [Leptospira soteropolitanensis]MCW7528492.1 hypothetical protein [Leptospira soteropolitanensis]
MKKNILLTTITIFLLMSCKTSENLLTYSINYQLKETEWETKISDWMKTRTNKKKSVYYFSPSEEFKFNKPQKITFHVCSEFEFKKRSIEYDLIINNFKNELNLKFTNLNIKDKDLQEELDIAAKDEDLSTDEFIRKYCFSEFKNSFQRIILSEKVNENFDFLIGLWEITNDETLNGGRYYFGENMTYFYFPAKPTILGNRFESGWEIEENYLLIENYLSFDGKKKINKKEIIKINKNEIELKSIDNDKTFDGKLTRLKRIW